MLVGIGVDLMENGRMRRELERGAWLGRDGVFTAREISFCGRTTRPAARFAACFAAKEATLKALGMYCRDLGMLPEIEVLFPSRRRERVILRRRAKAEAQRLGVAHIRASLTPTREFVAAMVILEGKPERSTP